jgi:glycosyltransferase involved in cell wall biosynthesis
MNILLINHYAGSIVHGMEYRPFYFAREWKNLGHSPHIIAASASHVRYISPKMRGLVTSEEIQGIPYLWVKTPGYNKNNARRVANMLAFVSWLTVNSGRIARSKRPDVVIASSTYPLDIIPAYLVAKHCGAKLIYEVHDLWPLSLIELGAMSATNPFIMLTQWAEDFAYRKADRVVSILPKSREHMVKRGMHPCKFHYVPNGIDIDEWKSPSGRLPENHEHVLTGLRKEGRFIVGYAGAHGLANALHNLVEAAGLLESQPVVIVLVGQGPEKEKLEDLTRQRGLENAIFLPPVARSCIPRLLALMDVLYIGLQKMPLFRFGISPNKLMDYMMAGKPVLQAIEAGNDMVASAGCGISLPPENPLAIANAVRKLMQLDEDERTLMGRRGQEFVLANHDYRILASNFIDRLI